MRELNTAWSTNKQTRMPHFSISKTEDKELPVPSAWRFALKTIADALVGETVIPKIDGFLISSPEKDQLQICRDNIEAYPDEIGSLNVESWNSSIHIWNNGYWSVLVDLTAHSGETTDLVFHAKVSEQGEQYLIEPGLIYVP